MLSAFIVDAVEGEMSTFTKSDNVPNSYRILSNEGLRERSNVVFHQKYSEKEAIDVPYDKYN